MTGYDRFFNLEPEDTADIYLTISRDLADDDNAEAALRAIRKPLKIQPDNGYAWQQMGMILLWQQGSDRAVAAFERAKALGERSFELHFRLAEGLSDLDRHQEAVDELVTAIDLQPSNAEAHYRLGVELDKMGKCEESVAALERSIELAPREVSYYQSLGFTLDAMGRRQEAIKCFKQAVELERRQAV